MLSAAETGHNSRYQVQPDQGPGQASAQTQRVWAGHRPSRHRVKRPSPQELLLHDPKQLIRKHHSIRSAEPVKHN